MMFQGRLSTQVSRATKSIHDCQDLATQEGLSLESQSKMSQINTADNLASSRVWTANEVNTSKILGRDTYIHY